MGMTVIESPVGLPARPEWEWEAQDDEGLQVLRKNSSTPRAEILDFLERKRTYLNRMYHAGIEPLEF
jgi:hypothetical protein